MSGEYLATTQCGAVDVAYWILARLVVGEGMGMNYCECGCGQVVKPGNRFVYHHWCRSPWVFMISDAGCWEWQGGLLNGYGLLWWEGKQILAHRHYYEKYVGPIPEGLCVCHKCDNRKCCNPDHLFLGTRPDNSRDMIAKERQARGEKHSQAKLTEAEVLEIRECAMRGESRTSLAQRHGVTYWAISHVVNRERWTHI